MPRVVDLGAATYTLAGYSITSSGGASIVDFATATVSDPNGLTYLNTSSGPSLPAPLKTGFWTVGYRVKFNGTPTKLQYWGVAFSNNPPNVFTHRTDWDNFGNPLWGITVSGVSTVPEYAGNVSAFYSNTLGHQIQIGHDFGSTQTFDIVMTLRPLIYR